MNWNFLQKQKAAISKILAATILCTSVFHPVMTLPAYATDSMVTVNCESTKPDDVQIYISSETVDLGPGNDIYLRVCVQNNTNDPIEDGILTWSDPEYVLSNDTSGFTYEGEDAWTDESGYLHGISLLPGETLEAEFSGTLDLFLDTDKQCELEFEFISDNENWNTVFPFTSGIVNLMPVETEPVMAGETGSMILTFAVNSTDEIIDLDSVLVATLSDAYESDKGTPSNATASNASPSDASLSDANPLFSLDGIELKLKTYGFELSDICVTDVSYSEMMEYVDVTVEYVVSANSNSGSYIGVINALVCINDTVYNVTQGCNNIIVENPESEHFKIIDTINQRINELPDKDSFLSTTDIFVNNEMWEDYDKYMKSLALSVVPIWELYLSLPESYHSLITNIDLLEFYYGLIGNVSFSGMQDQYSIIYSAADLSGCIRTTSLNNTTVSTNTVSGIIDSVILTVNNTSTTADDPYIWIDFPSAIDTEEYPFLSVKYKLLAGSAENIQMQIFPIEEGESASAQTSVICPIMGNSTEYSNCMFQFSNCQKYHDDPKTSGRLIKSIRLDYIDIFKVTDYSSGSHDSTEHGTVNGSQIQIESVTFHTMQQPDDIVPVESDAIKFQLFNYDQNINKTYDGTDWKPIVSYFTFRGKNGISQSEEVLFEDASIPEVSMNKTFDADGFVLEHATVERTLDESGYPVLDLTRFADGSSRTDENGNELLPDSILSQEDRSMKYLWSDEDPACKMYEPENGILQYNESNGLYYYDSRYNAVDYDVYQDRFYLRGYKERNNTTATYLNNTDETTGSVIPYYDLHPFDFTGGLTAGITSSDQIYQVKDLASDCWFGLRMDVDFYQGKNGEFMGQDMIFSFTGDDDIWVFVDDTLVLDLGGTHGAVTGTINFATGEINQYFNWNGINALEGDLVADTDTYVRSYQTSLKECFSAAGTTPFGGWDEQDVFSDYTVHKLSFFYLERGAAVANCALNFNLPTLPENSLKIAKELVSVEDDDLYEYIENSLYYAFRTLQTDKDGNVTDIPFIPENTLFSIYENDVLVDGAGVVEEDGYFYLKAGQSALFENVMELFDGDNPNNYIVEEILPVEFSGQYGRVEYEIKGDVNQAVGTIHGSNVFTSYQTDPISPEETQLVIYRNRINTAELGRLSVSKAAAKSSAFTQDDTFQIQVLFSGDPLTEGTVYLVGEEERESLENGIIELSVGETAVFKDGIISGTEYKIMELDPEDGRYKASYSGTVTSYEEEVSGMMECTDDGVTGTFPLSADVHVVIENVDYEVYAEISFIKQCLNNTGDDLFAIEITQVEENTWEPVMDVGNELVTVTDEEWSGDTVVIPYREEENGIYYYKFTVTDDGRDILYDETFYIIGIELSDEGASVFSILKNGTEELGTDAVVEFISEKVIRTLEGLVWNDKDRNGLRDQDEELFTEELEISLYKLKTDGDPSLETDYETVCYPDTDTAISIKNGQTSDVSSDPDTAVASHETGKWRFTNLSPGTYMVKITGDQEIVKQYRITSQNEGSDDTADSDGTGIYIKDGVVTSDDSGRLSYALITGLIMPEASELENAAFTLTDRDIGLIQVLATLTITKEIDARYIPFGKSSFIFRITGTDITGQLQKWIRIIELSDTFTGTCVLEDIPCSNEDGYTVTELSSNRYKNTDISCDELLSSDDHNVTVNLYDCTKASVLFKSRISVWDNLSHTENITQ